MPCFLYISGTTAIQIRALQNYVTYCTYIPELDIWRGGGGGVAAATAAAAAAAAAAAVVVVVSIALLIG